MKRDSGWFLVACLVLLLAAKAPQIADVIDRIAFPGFESGGGGSPGDRHRDWTIPALPGFSSNRP